MTLQTPPEFARRGIRSGELPANSPGELREDPLAGVKSGELSARHDAAEDLAGYSPGEFARRTLTTPSDVVRRSLLSPLEGVRSPARCGGSAPEHPKNTTNFLSLTPTEEALS